MPAVALEPIAGSHPVADAEGNLYLWLGNETSNTARIEAWLSASSGEMVPLRLPTTQLRGKERLLLTIPKAQRQGAERLNLLSLQANHDNRLLVLPLPALTPPTNR